MKVIEKEEDVFKNWENSLPTLKFDFYDYKTLYVNSADKMESLKKLWSPEYWDDKALSFWLIQY